MDDEITASLYSQVKDLTKQFAGKYEVGIAVEIQAALEETEEIQEFHKYWDQDGYFVIPIFLKHFDYQIASTIFSRLVHFIEYKDLTLYIQERRENAVHCILASSEPGGLRFACKVDFLPYVERK